MCVNICERRLSVDSDAECDQYLQCYFGHRNRFVLPYSLTMDAHAFNATPARRIIGYQCTNPHCGKLFTNVFAYDQHRNHAARAGTHCTSIIMREELTTVRARPRRGNERDARTKQDAHRRMILSLCRHVYQRPPSEIQTNSAHIEAML
jgi:hypothetical protein